MWINVSPIDLLQRLLSSMSSYRILTSMSSHSLAFAFIDDSARLYVTAGLTYSCRFFVYAFACLRTKVRKPHVSIRGIRTRICTYTTCAPRESKQTVFPFSTNDGGQNATQRAARPSAWMGMNPPLKSRNLYSLQRFPSQNRLTSRLT